MNYASSVPIVRPCDALDVNSSLQRVPQLPPGPLGHSRRSPAATRNGAFALIAAAAIFGAAPCAAHGIVGKRFFPATLTIDDPFVADELSLPTYQQVKLPGDDGGPSTWQTGLSFDYTKRITNDFAIGVGGTYLSLSPDGGPNVKGWDNFELGLKYQFFQNAEHEAIVSAGIDWDIGHSGSARVGAESISTFTPAIFFGKGAGDLPDSASFLRPFALTGQIGISIPSKTSTTTTSDDGDVETEQNPNNLVWGFALEYSIPYLQSFVKDMGWGAPFNRMIPIVEFNFSTALNRGASGTTGTINPGILWAGQSIQLGIEAVIPANSRTGSKTGVLAQLHFYLDDIFPTTIGKPLFGS